MKCGSIEDARHVFNKMPHHNVACWTGLTLAYAQKEEGALALEVYERMQNEGVQPSDQTFVGALKACTSLVPLEEGKQADGEIVRQRCVEKGRVIHSQALKSGCEFDVFVGSILVDMYGKCGSMEDAQHALDKLPHCDVV